MSSAEKIGIRVSALVFVAAMIAVGGRFRQLIGNRMVLCVDAYAAARKIRDDAFGARRELLLRF